MSQHQRTTIVLSCIIILLTNLIAILAGIIDAQWGKIYDYKVRCYNKKLRIEYIVPGYRIGCWLGQEVE